MIYLIDIIKSKNKNKKYTAIFNNGERVDFGDSRYEDYTTHHDDGRKWRYITRHINESNLWRTDPTAPASLSRWEHKNINTALRQYNSRF